MTNRTRPRQYHLTIALVLCLIPLLQLAQGRTYRNWKSFPAVVQIDTAEDVFAISDIHGDYDRLTKVLTGARIISGVPSTPEQVVWTAGKSVLIIVGDLIDKGPNGLGVIALIRALNPQAAGAGGRVVTLMGNHEAEFLANPDVDKAKDFLAELKTAHINNIDVGKCRGDIGQFLCSLPFAARVNDWFFAHAGNSDNRTLSRLDADLMAGVDRDGFKTRELQDPNSILLARIGSEGPGGKAWFEAGGPKQPSEQLLTSYAKALGVSHIVQGHTPKDVLFPDGQKREPGEMFQWRSLLFLIDTGMSQGVNYSSGAILRIQNRGTPEASAICVDGSVTKLWDAKSHPNVGKAGACRP